MSQQNKIGVRSETLRPFPEWEPPSPDEIRQVFVLAGERRGLKKLTGAQVADLVGASSTGAGVGKGSRTVRKWVGGESRIPYGAWAILCHEAGFGLIWRSEGLEKDPSGSGSGNPEI
ncbi:hypothetical protein [Salinimonas chungwhensis]|uniref:hypothetical protein n=1 Tax=Salinimonas chungwhensis TaxID=265425 RepID=UPI000371370C|nr:hypothetical protein [Salinimonas chungwhensis]